MSRTDPTRKPRNRQPTKHFAQYDTSADEGHLTTLSKSVGVVIASTPPGTHSAEQVKKQKASAAARGNTSLPGPLPPRKRWAHDDDDNEANADAGRELDNIEDEEERKEWLYLAIEKFGDSYDYRADPDFKDEHALLEVYQDLWIGSRANHNAIPPDPRIHKGMTKVLEPSTSKRSSAPKLVRTDSSTIGLDSTLVKAHGNQHREFGFLPAPKLARTDKTTISLDGTRISPPRAQALNKPSHRQSSARPANSHTLVNQPGSKSAHPAPATKPGVLQKPLLKRPIVSRAQVDALRQEARVCDAGAAAPAGASGATHYRADVPMHALSDEEEEMEPPLPNAGQQDEESGYNNDYPGKMVAITKRQATQLQSFGEATKLVKNMMEQLRIEMLVNCPYPERTPSARDPSRQKLDVWVIDLWANANAKLREDEPQLPLQDTYVSYVQHQLAPTRHALKKVCNNLDGPYFKLRHSDVDRVQHSKDLLNEEKWLSSFDDSKAGHLVASKNADNFRMYMKMLKEMQKNNEGSLKNACAQITEDYIKARANPAPAPVINMNFGPDQPVDEDRMNSIKALLGDAVGDVEEWGRVKSQKGNSRAAGPSRARRDD
ncbi:hypothetical protein FRC07_013711 [Ceratobasidium sp. 392]|nr:hypothetical protein FRC07_013711 [Ceratobasidium sp. 392]